MKGYRKILIAVNGALGPLKEGFKLASDEKCWITVLKVIPSYEGELNLTGIKNIRDVLDSGRDEVVRHIEYVANDERSLAKVRVEEGDIPGTISRIARQERCDLIIMGKKRHRGWLQRLLGDNISSEVLKMAPCPVLVVAE